MESEVFTRCYSVTTREQAREADEAPSDSEDITERAIDLFQEAYRRDMLNGRGAEPVAAACVYMACRVTGATVQVAADPDDGEPPVRTGSVVRGR